MSAFSASFQLDPQLSAPLYRQIYQRFKQAIMQNQLQAGERVPSARSLASELGVARATVDNAYGLLMAEGFLQSRGQAGTRVSLSLPTLSPLPERIPEPPRFTVNPMLPTSSPFPLELGLPALDAFPRAIWSRIVARQIRHTRIEDLGHAPLNGDAALRHEVAAYLQLSRGFSCRPEQVFICSGYAAVLDLVMGSLMQPQDGVWLEDPGYPVTQAFFRAAGATPMGIPVDGEGMNIDHAIQHFPQAKFAVVTPAHQSPMGVSLSLSRRMALLEWAASREAWIIEDDYDSEFRYQGQPLPSLKSLDAQGRVIYAGTFSKVMFPALRLGYVVVPEKLVDKVSDYCHLRACASPRLMQTSVAEFIAQGHFYRHLKRMRQLYVERRAFLTQALEARFPRDRLWVNPQAGGIQLCANLAASFDDAAIAQHARSQGLAIQALSDWQVEPREKGDALRPNGLLMGFPNILNQQQADKLVDKLAAILVESAERRE
ncbi:PLP-dependent aminotransferase family protein [Ewingella americana]|uniref:GntR family transcriptional regulator/aspartate aminotransferase n=2 Tax=Ewingella americana TaxID=41202 RepID=A0A085G7L7_EWIA3|nr:PLP-dependent aminotransferase family protein [Ewingella americana]KAA8726326.1 PLP-dependent aminotransferase family protein [Ewingella americana]KFC79712.1 GntR family transcriptional regulator/aspartate aminotransferase [Ewingella americana ATCC 33852]